MPIVRYVTSVARDYVPAIYKDRATLQRQLSEKILINQSIVHLSDRLVEVLALGLNFVYQPVQMQSPKTDQGEKEMGWNDDSQSTAD